MSNLNNVDELYLYDQKVYLDSIISCGNIKVINPLKDNNLMPVKLLSNINDNGSYDSKTNIISWSNLKEENDVEYEFAKRIKIGKASAKFSGMVTINIDVDIPDNNLKNVIIKKLGKKDGDLISKSEMESISELDGASSDITSIDGLEYCINLKYLELSDNIISDISKVSELTKLKYLYLSDNKISDITKLGKLLNLQQLYMDRNKISDISSIANLLNLKEIHLSNNVISNISSLNKLFNLEEITLDNNEISNIDSIEQLTKLYGLSLYNNKISNISKITGLTNLKYIYLANNNIKDLSHLDKLSNVKNRWIDNQK